MRDPFFIAPIPFLVDWVQPWCERLHLPSLPLHIHEVLAAALLYSVIFYPCSPIISNLLAPHHYPRLSRKKKLNWDAHVVSLVQSTLINCLALWVMAVDEDRRYMGWQERVWGYTGASGMIQALAAGYFVWDLIVTSCNLDVFGFGTLAHAIAALLVYTLGFRPFVNYYSCIFILWELSTPFLNIHWFMDKVEMTGSRAQLFNGFLLLFSFFSCRLVYGTYQSITVFRDIWMAIDNHPGGIPNSSVAMAFVTENTTVPLWLAAVYLSSNLTLNTLNFYWFVMMIRAVRKRFEPAKAPQKERLIEVEVKPCASVSSISCGPNLQRRKHDGSL
ncbi:hypothetical protein CDD83_1971 [Cordyceps sp. RAO-2017]|nr:hypothetical protein CDD83_1971 [Cordyceps sp. RAO-2017]